MTLFRLKAMMNDESPGRLPMREDAERCPSTDRGRRCVLPPGHRGDHVYPPLT
ncbi:hypothetical protein ACWENQ_26250 [Nonomuraea sp. NPDC004354]